MKEYLVRAIVWLKWFFTRVAPAVSSVFTLYSTCVSAWGEKPTTPAKTAA